MCQNCVFSAWISIPCVLRFPGAVFYFLDETHNSDIFCLYSVISTWLWFKCAQNVRSIVFHKVNFMVIHLGNTYHKIKYFLNILTFAEDDIFLLYTLPWQLTINELLKFVGLLNDVRMVVKNKAFLLQTYLYQYNFSSVNLFLLTHLAIISFECKLLQLKSNWTPSLNCMLVLWIENA